jgi:hypothetical protein
MKTSTSTNQGFAGLTAVLADNVIQKKEKQLQ